MKYGYIFIVIFITRVHTMLPMLLTIMSIFDIAVKYVGPIVTSSKHTMLSGILGAITDGKGATGIIGIIESVIGKIEDAKKQEMSTEIAALLAQTEIDKIEAKEAFFDRGWRPALAWGLSIITVVHLVIAEFSNLLALYHGSSLAPMDTMTTILLTGLLGIYMTARTVEKVNSNQD